MNTNSFAINKTMLANMMLNPARFMLGSFLLEVGLEVPDKELKGNTRKEKANSGRVPTNEGTVSLENLADNAMLRFKARIIAPIVFTSFKHELLAKQNETTHEHEMTFWIDANDSTITVEASEFLGTQLKADDLHKLIRIYVSQSKNETKISAKWRKRQGSYEVKRNGEFVPYANEVMAVLEKLVKPETENLAPIVDNVPFGYVMDIEQAYIQAHKENKARNKATVS